MARSEIAGSLKARNQMESDPPSDKVACHLPMFAARLALVEAGTERDILGWMGVARPTVGKLRVRAASTYGIVLPRLPARR